MLLLSTRRVVPVPYCRNESSHASLRVRRRTCCSRSHAPRPPPPSYEWQQCAAGVSISTYGGWYRGAMRRPCTMPAANPLPPCADCTMQCTKAFSNCFAHAPTAYPMCHAAQLLPCARTRQKASAQRPHCKTRSLCLLKLNLLKRLPCRFTLRPYESHVLQSYYCPPTTVANVGPRALLTACHSSQVLSCAPSSGRSWFPNSDPRRSHEAGLADGGAQAVPRLAARVHLQHITWHNTHPPLSCRTQDCDAAK